MGYLQQLMTQSNLTIAESQARSDQRADDVETTAAGLDIAVHEQVEAPAANMQASATGAPDGEEAAREQKEVAPPASAPLRTQTPNSEPKERTGKPLTPREPGQDYPAIAQDHSFQEEHMAAASQPLEQTFEREVAPGAGPDAVPSLRQAWKANGPVQPTSPPKTARSSGRKQDPVSPEPWSGEEVLAEEASLPSQADPRQDKAALSAYVLREVTQWVSQEEEPVPTALSPDKQKRAAAATVQEQQAQRLLQPREEQVQLSIGDINVVVEAPAAALPQPAVQPAGTVRPAPSFLRWQRHYFDRP